MLTLPFFPSPTWSSAVISLGKNLVLNWAGAAASDIRPAEMSGTRRASFDLMKRRDRRKVFCRVRVEVTVGGPVLVQRHS